MSFLASMQKRYTTKNYDSSKKIDPKQIAELKEILRLTPSSVNSQPWQFIFVSDPVIREKLSKVSMHNTNKVLDCDTVVVFSRIDNIPLFEKRLESSTHPMAANYFKELKKPLPREQINSWFSKQVYLALGIFLSACAEMGIDATPMEGIESQQYDKILDQKDYKTLVAVAIGYRTADDFNQPSKIAKWRRPLEEVVRAV